jgi:hypothetical protein
MGTKPLASGLAKLLAHALKKGLQAEVQNMPEHTRVDKAILAKDWSTLFRDAEEMLQEEQPDARRHHGRKINLPSKPEFLSQNWGCK